MGLFDDDVAADMQDAEYAAGTIEAKHELFWGAVMIPTVQVSTANEFAAAGVATASKHTLSEGGAWVAQELYSGYVSYPSTTQHTYPTTSLAPAA